MVAPGTVRSIATARITPKSSSASLMICAPTSSAIASPASSRTHSICSLETSFSSRSDSTVSDRAASTTLISRSVTPPRALTMAIVGTQPFSSIVRRDSDMRRSLQSL